MIYIKNVSIKILVFYLICQVVFCINYHIHFGVIDIKIYFAILWILNLMTLLNKLIIFIYDNRFKIFTLLDFLFSTVKLHSTGIQLLLDDI